MILRIALGTLSVLLVAIGGVVILTSLLFLPAFEAGNEDRYVPWLVSVTLAVLISLAAANISYRCLRDLRVGRFSLTAQGLALAIMATVTVDMWFLGDPDAEWFSLLTGLLATNLLLSALQRRSPSVGTAVR